MGSFSFMKADNLTQVANIVYNKPFKFLIPAQFAVGEFSKGYIKDKYQDYGYLDHKKDENGNPIPNKPRFDVHELLAVWNGKRVRFKEYTSPDGLYTLSETDFDCLDRLIANAEFFSQKSQYLQDQFVVKYLHLKNFKKKDFTVKEKWLVDFLRGDKYNPMKEIDKDTEYNRGVGIDLFYSSKYKNPEVYKLKFVSCSYNHTYEECENYSTDDPEQGCMTKRRKNL